MRSAHKISNTLFVDCMPCETRDASCICIDSRDFFFDKHFRGHDIMEAVAVAAEAAHCESSRGWHAEFTASCSDVVALARAIFWCVQLLNLGVRHERLSLSPDGKFQNYLVKNANPIVLHLSGMCVCHHGTPVPNENTTSLQPSTSLRSSSPPTHLPATDHEDGVTKLMCYSFGSHHSGTYTRQQSCVLPLSGWIPKHVREHAVANPRWIKVAPDTTTPHLFR